MSLELIKYRGNLIEMVKVKGKYSPVIIQRTYELYDKNKKLNSKIKKGIFLEARI